MSDNATAALLGAALFMLYFLPIWVAYARKHHNTAAIGALNLFLGWTFLGWVGALIWSFTAVRLDTSTPSQSQPTVPNTNQDPNL